MKVIYTDSHKRHHSQELSGGELVMSFEMPQRAEFVRARAEEVGIGEFVMPKEFPISDFEMIHTKEYIDFLQTAFSRWQEAGNKGRDAYPTVWPVHGMRRIRPLDIDGQLGFHSHSMDCGIGEHSWDAAKWSAYVALTGQELISKGGEKAAFSLCRPPGHHAHKDLYGGFCFINNSALSAQAFIRDGVKKVAVLDVDYHHGNGTQDIFYERADVLTISLHADPAVEYPTFLGYADEVGEGAGEGFNVNYPMPFGTTFPEYEVNLKKALQKIKDFGAEVVVIALGVDTFKDDPISQFKLDSPDYLTIGQYIASIDVPTHFVLEGGYAVEQIGVNAINVLTGYENA